MEKISKSKARVLYDKGKTVFLLPSKIRVENSWIKPYPINKSTTEPFDKIVNSYEYYNCNADCGWIVAYYVEGENRNDKRR